MRIVTTRVKICTFYAGFITNVATFITLAVNGEEFAPCIRLLLKHQSLIDAFACLVSAITILQKPLWLSGKKKDRRYTEMVYIGM